MQNRLFALVLLAAIPFASGAEQRLHLVTTIREARFQTDRESLGPVLASPIFDVQSGHAFDQAVLNYHLSIVATLEGDASARIAVAMGKLDERLEPGSSVLVKLGEKATLVCGVYRVEVVPTLAENGMMITFAGGELSALIKQLKEDRRASLNILVGGDVPVTTDVPAFSVRNASVSDVAAALDLLLSEKRIAVVVTGKDPSADPILVFKYNAAPLEREAFACRDLSGYFEKKAPANVGEGRNKVYSLDEIVGIINEAYELQFGRKPGSDLKFKYNPDSKLLFIVGSRQAVDTAQQTLDTLPKPVKLF